MSSNYQQPLTLHAQLVYGAHGIENTKAVLQEAAKIAYESFQIDSNHDGKKTGDEYLIYGTRIVPALFAVVTRFPGVIEETSGGELKKEEFDELVDFVVSLDLLPPDKDNIEQFVDQTILWVKSNAEYIRYATTFFKGTKEIAEPQA
ncbi:MAG: hypothetical protein HC874_14310 [Richelia sp. SL_2_1]|nr:hypothetical protein [Richelia sp. SL_2_1]